MPSAGDQYAERLVFITLRFHLFPFRTQKLSSAVPTILGGRPPGKIGLCQHEKDSEETPSLFFLLIQQGFALADKLKRMQRFLGGFFS